MYSGANATVFVSNLDEAVRFYHEALGLKLLYRFGDHFAAVQAPGGFTIGLHPASPEGPAGVRGSIEIGLELDEPLTSVQAALESRGMKFTAAPREGKAGTALHFEDPDGNRLYLFEPKWSHIRQGEGEYPGAPSR